MLDDFLLRAGLAAVGTAVAAGLLGCFVVWRRMAYFGDATAHAAVLGVALALLFGTSITLGVGIVALCMAVLIHSLSGQGVAVDTILGVLAHGAMGWPTCGGNIVRPGPGGSFSRLHRSRSSP